MSTVLALLTMLVCGLIDHFARGGTRRRHP